MMLKMFKTSLEVLWIWTWEKEVFPNQMKIIISSVMKLMMKFFLYPEQGSDVKQNGQSWIDTVGNSK